MSGEHFELVRCHCDGAGAILEGELVSRHRKLAGARREADRLAKREQCLTRVFAVRDGTASVVYRRDERRCP